MRALALGLVLLAHAAAPGADPACWLDAQAARFASQLATTTSRLAPKQKQLDAMTQTAFPTAAAATAYEVTKAKLAAEVLQLKQEQALLSGLSSHWRQHRALFPAASEGASCDWFHPRAFDPAAGEDAFAKARAALERAYPTRPLSLPRRPQALVYPDAAKREQFRQVPAAVRELMSSAKGREIQRLLDETAGAAPPLLLLTPADPPAAVAREAARALLDRLLDPSKSPAAAAASRPVLREGFAENLAATLDESLYLARAKSLAVPGPAPDEAALAALLDSDAPGAAGLNEATVLARWLAGLPDGFPLLLQMMTCRHGEHASVLRNHQSAHGAERIGLAAYLPWRAEELKRVAQPAP
jgi:hypothetical protein